MTANLLPNAKVQFVDLAGRPLVDGKVYMFVPSSTTPKTTWQDAGQSIANTNPIELDERGEAIIWGVGTYRQQVYDADGNLIWDQITTDGSGVFLLRDGSNVDMTTQQKEDFLTYIGGGDSANSTFIQGGAGAVERTAQNKMRDWVSIVDFGGQSGMGFDNTAAMDAAETYLATRGGGVIIIPYAGEWCMNWTCMTSNIKVFGAGGNAQYDLNCIRPYDLSKWVWTFGDGATEVRHCGYWNCQFSGTNGTPAADTDPALNAPGCLLLRGGVLEFRGDPNGYFFNGLETIKLLPSLAQPVTGIEIGGGCRNDVIHADARGILAVRVGTGEDNGYLTAVQFTNFKMNSGEWFVGFACELRGDGAAVAFKGIDCYWDIRPEHGILINGAGSILTDELNLDPGVNGGVVITCSQVGLTDLTRLLNGKITQGAQAWRNGWTSGAPLAGTKFSMADEANFYSYRPSFVEPVIKAPIYLGDATNAQDRSGPYIDYNEGSRLVSIMGAGLKVQDGLLYLSSATRAQLVANTPPPFAGAIIYVSDGAGNKHLAVGDNSSWKYTDGVIVT